MRNAKTNSRMMLVASILMSLLLICSAVRLMASAEAEEETPLEHLIGNSQAAIGNNYGTIYALTGEELLTDRDGKRVAVSGFTNIIGCESSGMMYRLKSILLSNRAQINRSEHQGNSIVSTLHTEGQLTAVSVLSTYDVDQVEASVTVLTGDGAVIVSAGNNSYSSSVYAREMPPKDLYIDYSESAKEKGSCFKPVTYRMLLQNVDMLPEELDITGDSFTDVSYVMSGENTVHNWDWSIPNHYESGQNGLYQRNVSLSALLQYSSNTAPLRCCKALGFKESYEQMKQMYGIDRPLITEINSIDGISPPKERLPYLVFGQDAYLSPVRMCVLFNHVVSGRLYAPFYTASVIQPDGAVIYRAAPAEKKEYHMDIDVENDILNNALEDTFESYLTNRLRAKYPEKVLTSRRLLAKSGTSENADGSENRTVMLTLLNEERSDVICSACITVNNTYTGIGNDVLLDKLLQVLCAMDMLEGGEWL